MTPHELARLATAVEQSSAAALDQLAALPEGDGLIVGITGPPGAGKSTLVDAMIAELRGRNRTVAVLAVDPSSRATGGAILGDRIRMQRHHDDSGVFIRSLATRGVTGGLSAATRNLARLFRAAGFDFVLIETVGVGQDEIDIASVADVVTLVLTPGAGDDIQALKAGIMEIAGIFVINKADLPGAERTHSEIAEEINATTAPIFETVATTGAGVPALLDHLQTCRRRNSSIPAGGVIDHLGIAVKSIDEALAFYEQGLGLRSARREAVEQEKVRVAMMPVGDSRVELLEPLDAASPLARFLERRGPGLHHVALRVPDFAATVARLEKEGARLIGTPQRGAGGHLYVFVHPESTGGVLWEIIQE